MTLAIQPQQNIDVESNTPADVPVPKEKETILIVEDSATEEIRLSAMLKKQGYNVVTAKDGNDALRILNKQMISFILSDWRMPELTGIQLCRIIRSDSQYGQPYFVLLTGCDTQMDLIAGMEAGADDFITKPFSSEELRVRVQAGMRIVRLKRELELQNEQLFDSLEIQEALNSRIQKDLNSAAKMQTELLPDDKSPSENINIATMFEPASTIAGDGYNYFSLDENNMAFYHLDVAGHGIASAMLSFTISRLLSPGSVGNSMLLDRQNNSILLPRQVIKNLNEYFLDRENSGLYFTMVYGVINTKTGEGKLCQAGHPHPIICSSEGAFTEIGEGGFPVGMLEKAGYEDIDFQLNPGDRLWLYSDGIPDCLNPINKAFGMNNFKSVIKKVSRARTSKIPGYLDSMLKRWRADRELEDDLSLLVIEAKANSKED